MRTKTLPDVQSREQRTLSIIAPNFSPDNVIVASIYPGDRGGHYPVEVRRKDLLAALGAEPDESDYTEVVAENTRLGWKLSAALRERDANRAERDAALSRIQALLPDRDSWKARAEEARKERDEAREALRAAEEPRDDQDQIDRSWALEKARKERDEARSRLAEAAKEIREQGETIAELAAEQPRDDQDQIDRSWALEKAGEVLGRLAAVGALPKDWAGLPVLSIAEWILNGETVDRG